MRPFAVAAVALALLASACTAEPVAQFDFGTADSPVQPGFDQVTASTEYTAERGFGWESAAGLKDSDKVNADDLQRDFVYGYAQTGPLTASFLVDLPNGDYWMALFAGDIQYSRGELPFDVLVNGNMTIEQWRNRRWEYQLAPAKVEGAQLRVTFQSSQTPDQRYSGWFVNALVVYSATTREQAQEQTQALVDSLLAARYADYEEVYPDPAPDEGEITAQDRERGYVAFARDYLRHVWPGTLPSDAERTAEIDCWATQGEYEPASFAVVPLRDLGTCTVQVTDLQGDEGVLPAASWDIRLARILRQRVGRNDKKFRRGPKVLDPGAEAEITAGDTRWWWLTVKVPDDQPPGHYRGEVVFTPGSGEPWRCPVRLRVLPLKMQKPPGEIFGMYYGTGYAYFPENRIKHF
ncbi:MAG TPA: hypothetical protein VM283_00245, partial [Armatimonadota bacterium]|nr:hypothetical protein [Armatimonadota bacterium]